MGPPAVQAIIPRLEGRAVFNRGTCLLAPVLKRIGAPAHQGLLAAVDNNPKTERIIGYIYVLAEDFRDFSLLPRWIEYQAARHRRDLNLDRILYREFQHAPMERDENGGFTEDFVRWFERAKKNGRFVQRASVTTG